MISSTTTSPIAISFNNDELKQYSSNYSYALCEEDIPVYNDRANYQKNECFMKSPLTVYNHCHVKGVLQNAYFMRQELELKAVALKAITGIYIRPILLFVLKNQTADTKAELERIKLEFINSGLPEDQLKLKTNVCDELKNLDLESEGCEVRYIITLSNLKTTWKCPFIYIIASMEDRNTAADLSGVVNHLLPVPARITNHHHPLNTAYILVATSKYLSAP